MLDFFYPGSAASRLDRAAAHPGPDFAPFLTAVDKLVGANIARFTAQQRQINEAVSRINRVEQQLRYAKDGI